MRMLPAHTKTRMRNAEQVKPGWGSLFGSFIMHNVCVAKIEASDSISFSLQKAPTQVSGPAKVDLQKQLA